MEKGSIKKHHIILINMYVPNIWSIYVLKANINSTKEYINRNTVIRAFNIIISMDTSSR